MLQPQPVSKRQSILKLIQLRPLSDDVIDELVVQAMLTPGRQPKDVIRALVRLVELEHQIRLWDRR